MQFSSFFSILPVSPHFFGIHDIFYYNKWEGKHFFLINDLKRKITSREKKTEQCYVMNEWKQKWAQKSVRLKEEWKAK